MANAASMSLDQMLQESRQKRRAEALAQEIFGKKNRSRTPQGPRAATTSTTTSTLASRVGVVKRTNSLPRPNSVPAARNVRPPPPTAPTRPAQNSFRAKSHFAQPPSAPVREPVSSNNQRYDAPAPVVATVPENISFRGAAQTGPYIVIAENFAQGTTSADIESVMTDVGGQVLQCKMLANAPTVIAEITFADKSGADTVINTFNGKKADGLTLNVYLRESGGAKLDAFVDLEGAAPEEAMEIDENAQAREAEDRLREERRGRNDRPPRDPRDPRDPGYPQGPPGGYPRDDGYYGRGPRRAEPAFQDGRYGYGGGDRYNNGGRYHGGGRMYSDGMGRRGQSWRP